MNGRKSKLRRIFEADQAAAAAEHPVRHLTDAMVTTARALARSDHPLVQQFRDDYRDRARLAALTTCAHNPTAPEHRWWTPSSPATLICSWCYRDMAADLPITGCHACGRPNRIIPVVLTEPDQVSILIRLCDPCISTALGGA